jgi:cyclopropane-fatty-acyl-phospholipid synthase
MVGEEVARVWRLYLVGGGLSFEEGRMGVDQILAVKPSRWGASARPAVARAGPAPNERRVRPARLRE